MTLQVHHTLTTDTSTFTSKVTLVKVQSKLVENKGGSVNIHALQLKVSLSPAATSPSLYMRDASSPAAASCMADVMLWCT